jgi:ABC-type nitrate/sulfonate/bicarbonate transport system permease component
VNTLRKKYKKEEITVKDLKGSFFLKYGKKIKNTLILLLVIVAILLMWELCINHFDIPKRILPKPSDLIQFFQKEFLIPKTTRYTTVLGKAMESIKDAFIGFVISLILGSGIGILLSQNKKIYSAFFPIVFLTQLIPVPALAPVLAGIFGYGYSTKLILIVLFTIFPVAIAVRSSVLNIPENYTQLLSTYTDSKIQNFKYLILPSLVPPLLSIMKILSTASIVATIVTELPLSVRKGIGKDIYNSFNNQMIPRVWVSVIIISVLSLIFFSSLNYLEKYLDGKYKYGHY